MTISRDEITRQLRATDEAHRQALPRFGAALRRAFDPDGDVPVEGRGALVGVPTSRRGFLRIGGMTVAASAFLVACGSDTSSNVSQIGSLPPDPNAFEIEKGDELNMTLLLTASSVEALAIATYQEVLDQGLLDSADLDAAVTLFRDQHADHLGLLSATVRDLGGTPYETPNEYLDVNVVQPAVAGLADLETPEEVTSGTLDIAYTLEDAAAQTYVQAAGLLDTIELRQAIMSIGGVEARHIAVILGALDEVQAPFAIMPVGAAVPKASYITADGPVTEVTTTTAAPAEDGSGDSGSNEG